MSALLDTRYLLGGERWAGDGMGMPHKCEPETPGKILAFPELYTGDYSIATILKPRSQKEDLVHDAMMERRDMRAQQAEALAFEHRQQSADAMTALQIDTRIHQAKNFISALMAKPITNEMRLEELKKLMSEGDEMLLQAMLPAFAQLGITPPKEIAQFLQSVMASLTPAEEQLHKFIAPAFQNIRSDEGNLPRTTLTADAMSSGMNPNNTGAPLREGFARQLNNNVFTMSSVTGSGTMRASAPAFMTAQSTAFIPRGSENFGSGAVGGGDDPLSRAIRDDLTPSQLRAQQASLRAGDIDMADVLSFQRRRDRNRRRGQGRMVAGTTFYD